MGIKASVSQEFLRALFNSLGIEGEVLKGNLLRQLYWQGKADSIVQEVGLLRQLVEQTEAASQGLAELSDSYEQNLKKVEKVSQSYKP